MGTVALLAPFGVSPFVAGGVLSAVATAIGAGLTHAASRVLGLNRADALLVAALTACTPAVMFYASVVELHGVFYAFAALGALRASHLIATPTVANAVLLGLATALAYCFHSTGHLLPLLFAAMFWGARGGGVGWPRLPATRRTVLGRGQRRDARTGDMGLLASLPSHG